MIPTENLRTSYLFYRKYTDQPVESNIYLKIISAFIKFIMDKVFEGHEVELSGGSSLGTLQIVGYKQRTYFNGNGQMKGRGIDWPRTLKHWNETPGAKENKEYIFHLNEHTNGVMYNFRWTNFKTALTNKGYYTLCMSRKNRRRLADLVTNHGKEYIILDSKEKNLRPQY